MTREGRLLKKLDDLLYMTQARLEPRYSRRRHVAGVLLEEPPDGRHRNSQRRLVEAAGIEPASA